MLKLHQDVKYAVPPNLRLSKNKHHLNGSNVATVADYARENKTSTHFIRATHKLPSICHLARSHLPRAL